MNIYIITNETYFKCYVVASDLKKALEIYENDFGAKIIDIEIILKENVIIGE